MIKAIMAVDNYGGIGKNGTMPWPKNSLDLQWFKKQTLNNVVVMGKLTWIDSNMPTPLKNRKNILITNSEKNLYPGADEYLSGDLVLELKKLSSSLMPLDIFIIGGPNIIDQLFELIEEFYLTRIYGNYKCDNFLDLNRIKNSMRLIKNIKGDSSCHFEIWSK